MSIKRFILLFFGISLLYYFTSSYNYSSLSSSSSSIRSSSSSVAYPSSSSTKTRQQSVYICNGSSAYAYHRRINCSGINRCGSSKSAVFQSEVMASRTACKICYRR